MLLPTEHRKACSMNCDQLEAASNSICWGHHSGFSKFCGSRHDSSCWCQRQPLSLPPSLIQLPHTHKQMFVCMREFSVPGCCGHLQTSANLFEICLLARGSLSCRKLFAEPHRNLQVSLTCNVKNCFCLLQKALWCPVGSTCVKRI